MVQKKILVSPLNWGLGHATRCIPIIKEFLRRGHIVDIAATGKAKLFLQKEFPSLNFIEFPDYPAPYPENRGFLVKFALKSPNILAAIYKEKKMAAKFFQENNYDIIISDARFEIRAKHIPSYLIAHQIRFKVPYIVGGELTLEYFNKYHYKKFDKIIVPDFEDNNLNLSGKLSHRLRLMKKNKLYYAGPICDIDQEDADEDIDYYISISGVGPDRQKFEDIIMEQLHNLSGNVVVSLGQPGDKEVKKVKNAVVHSYMPREEQKEAIKRSKCVICRGGYTTVMELAALGKKALFVPTKGQTEQEYIAKLYNQKKWFYSVKQDKLNLSRDVSIAKSYSGFPQKFVLEENVKNLFDNVFEKHLK